MVADAGQWAVHNALKRRLTLLLVLAGTGDALCLSAACAAALGQGCTTCCTTALLAAAGLTEGGLMDIGRVLQIEAVGELCNAPSLSIFRLRRRPDCCWALQGLLCCEFNTVLACAFSFLSTACRVRSRTTRLYSYRFWNNRSTCLVHMVANENMTPPPNARLSSRSWLS